MDSNQNVLSSLFSQMKSKLEEGKKQKQVSNPHRRLAQLLEPVRRELPKVPSEQPLERNVNHPPL